MAEQEMLLDSATIKAAVAGEKWATEKVIEHYAPMIDELAVDEDMKQHLIMKLRISQWSRHERKNSAGRRGHIAPAPGASCLTYSSVKWNCRASKSASVMVSSLARVWRASAAISPSISGSAAWSFAIVLRRSAL